MTKQQRLTILIGVIIVSLVIIVSVNRSPFGKKNTSLAVPKEKDITRIELSEGNKKLVLSRYKDLWLLNGKAETRKTSINFIIKILKEMTIKSPVSPDMFKQEISDKEIPPVRVRAFENRRILCDFLVYKTRSNAYGNIIKKSSRSKPFIFYVPGHDNEIGSAFTLNQLYWQPYTIFNLMPSEISSVTFENIPDTSNSFTIKNTGRKFILTDGRREVNCDSSTLKRYLSYFTFIPFESWAIDMKEEDKARIINSIPIYRIRVTSVKGEDIMLTLWTRTNEKGEPDSDRLYGATGNSGEIFVVRYFDIDPVLKRRDYFNKS